MIEHLFLLISSLVNVENSSKMFFIHFMDLGFAFLKKSTSSAINIYKVCNECGAIHLVCAILLCSTLLSISLDKISMVRSNKIRGDLLV